MSNKLVKGPIDGPKNLYICDPKKNVNCSGRFKDDCGVKCFCTANPALSTNAHQLTDDEYYKEQGLRRLRLENLLRQKKGI